MSSRCNNSSTEWKFRASSSFVATWQTTLWQGLISHKTSIFLVIRTASSMESQGSPTKPSHGIDHGLRMPTLLEGLCMCRTWDEMVVCEGNIPEADFTFACSRRAPDWRWRASLLKVVLYNLPKKFQRVIRIRHHAIGKQAVNKASGGRFKGDVIYVGDVFPCLVRRVFHIVWQCRL